MGQSEFFRTTYKYNINVHIEGVDIYNPIYLVERDVTQNFPRSLRT